MGSVGGRAGGCGEPTAPWALTGASRAAPRSLELEFEMHIHSDAKFLTFISRLLGLFWFPRGLHAPPTPSPDIDGLVLLNS